MARKNKSRHERAKAKIASFVQQLQSQKHEHAVKIGKVEREKAKLEDDLRQANRCIEKMKIEHESSLFFIYDIERKSGMKASDVGWRVKKTKDGYKYSHPNDHHKYLNWLL